MAKLAIRKKHNVPLPLTAIYTPVHVHSRGYNLRIIQEYFQPKIGKKIRIFSLGQKKKNTLIKRKECVNLRLFNNIILLFNENSVRCLRLLFIWAYFLFFLGEKFKEEVKNLDEGPPTPLPKKQATSQRWLGFTHSKYLVLTHSPLNRP